jgi:hypothetical protein
MQIMDNSEYIQNYIAIHFTKVVNRMMIFFSHQFSPYGRAGGFHALRAALTAPLLLKARNPASSGMASPLSAPLCGMKHPILLC